MNGAERGFSPENDSDSSSKYIDYEEFTRLGLSRGYEEKTLKGTWTTGQKIDDMLQPMTRDVEDIPDNQLDLALVLAYMKLVIKGIVPLRIRGASFMIGRKNWEIFCELIQERFPDDPEVPVLTWIDDIHQHFNSGDEGVRLKATEDLYNLYFPPSE